MAVGAGISVTVSVSDGKLMVCGNCILHDVHENIVITPSASASGDALINGAFIGVRSNQKGSRRVFPIGKLDYGKDIHIETQFLLVEACGNGDGADESTLYTVFSPILEGDFRAVLQGNENNEMEICLESAM